MRTIFAIAIAAAIAATSFTTQVSAANPTPTAGLKDPSHKPKKGVIFIKTKKFTSCTDWGKDKGWCKKHL